MSSIPPCDLAILDPSNPASPLAYGSAQSALLLLDYHNFIVSALGEAGLSTVTKANSMREWAKTNGIAVFHCLIDIKSTGPPPSKRSFERFGKIAAAVAAQPAGAEEHPIIAMREGEHSVTRVLGYVSALKSDGLVALFESNGIKSLILCGLSTSGCVLSTTKAATDSDYVVTVISDACADRTVEIHNTVANSVLTSSAHVVETDEFQRSWNSSP